MPKLNMQIFKFVNFSMSTISFIHVFKLLLIYSFSLFFFLLHPLPAFFSKLLFFTFYKLHTKVLINTGGAFVTLID